MKTKREKLPRGVRRRGNSLIVYLTIDGKPELRSMGMVSPKTADTQRKIWQREIAEGRYVKPLPTIQRILFSTIADRALDHARNYSRFWDSTASRIKRMTEWWGTLAAASITTAMIDTQLLSNIAPRGLCWCETTSNEYRATLSHIYKLAIDRGDLTANPATKSHRYKLNNARTRELSFTEEDRLRAAIRGPSTSHGRASFKPVWYARLKAQDDGALAVDGSKP